MPMRCRFITSVGRKGKSLDSVDIMESPFWFVWSRLGQPTHQHFKKAEAMFEAERLSKKHIDTPFYVAEVQFGYLSSAHTTKIHLIGEIEDEA